MCVTDISRALHPLKSSLFRMATRLALHVRGQNRSWCQPDSDGVGFDYPLSLTHPHEIALSITDSMRYAQRLQMRRDRSSAGRARVPPLSPVRQRELHRDKDAHPILDGPSFGPAVWNFLFLKDNYTGDVRAGVLTQTSDRARGARLLRTKMKKVENFRKAEWVKGEHACLTMYFILFLCCVFSPAQYVLAQSI